MFLIYSFLIVSGLFLPGCVPVALFGSGVKLGSSTAEERGLGGVISDTALKNTINYRLLKHSVGLFSKISVSLHQGQALVTGVVDTPQLKTEALRIIKGVGGVKNVIDEITVAKLDLSQIGIDSWVTTQLTSALAIDPEIESINYKIKTENGVVYLTGIAQHPQELTKVTEKARNIARVKKVVSHVKIKNSIPKIVTHNPEVSKIEDNPVELIEDNPVTVTETENLPDESPLAGLD